MGPLVWHSTWSAFHSFITNKLQSENQGTYVHFVFIYKTIKWFDDIDILRYFKGRYWH